MARGDQTRHLSTLGRRNFCIALAAALTMGAIAAQAAPVTVGGPFTLVAPDGAVVTDRTYRGKWLLVYFGFTFCPNTCPMALVEIGTALEKLGRNADDLQPLFITVDPLRDTPAVMGDYIQSFDPRIVGLTGTLQQIAAAAAEYGVYYAPHKTGPGPDDYVMDHGTYLYLMDPEGKFVRGFDADTSGDRIADAVRDIIAQWRAESGDAPTSSRPR
jgi:protein SCO1/2